LRVLTPLTYASCTTATRARSARRRSSSSHSGKYEPVRSLKDGQLERARATVERSDPVAVALAHALGRPLVGLDPEPVGHVSLHESLDRPAQGLSDDIRSGRAGGLFESGEQCHPLVGHRGGLPSERRHSLEDHAVTLAVKGLDLHHVLGHYFGCDLSRHGLGTELLLDHMNG
jgi:hypothetical protein